MKSLDGFDNLFMLGKAAHFLLREDLPAVNRDDEIAAPALEQFGIGVKFILQLGGQTGRPGKVVSLHAVFNGDMHTESPCA